jgi:hypothetical protein
MTACRPERAWGRLDFSLQASAWSSFDRPRIPASKTSAPCGTAPIASTSSRPDPGENSVVGCFEYFKTAHY